MLLPTLVVVHVLGPASHIDAAALSKEIEAQFSHRHGLALIERGPTFSKTDMLQCGIALPCVAEVFRLAHVSRALRVTLNIDLGLASIQLVDADRVLLLAEAVVDVAQDVDVMSLVVREAGLLLDRAGHEVWGKLVIHVQPTDARIAVSPEGEPQGAGVLVRPGLYEVTAERDGFTKGTAFGEIRAGEEKTIDLPLAKLEAPSVLHSPWFWGAVGAAAVIATTTLVMIRPFSDVRECACVSYSDTSCTVCTP